MNRLSNSRDICVEQFRDSCCNASIPKNRNVSFSWSLESCFQCFAAGWAWEFGFEDFLLELEFSG
jgi:hypothetical protein